MDARIKMNRDSGHRFQGVRSVVARIGRDGVDVVPIERGAENRDSIYGFNETGARLWGLFQEGRGLAASALRPFCGRGHGGRNRVCCRTGRKRPDPARVVNDE